MYAASATASAYFFATWKRADADLRSRVWRRYGWFSALAFLGSCAGLATAVGDNQFRYAHRVVAFLFVDNPCEKILNNPDDSPEWIQALIACFQARGRHI